MSARSVGGLVPICTVSYRENYASAFAAQQLVSELPGIVVDAMNANVRRLRLEESTVQVQFESFGRFAVNVPGVRVVVQTAHGQSRSGQILTDLRDGIKNWLSKLGDANQDEIGPVQIEIWFMPMCGVRLDPVRGREVARWGASS